MGQLLWIIHNTPCLIKHGATGRNMGVLISNLLNHIILTNGVNENLNKNIDNKMIIRSEYNNIFASFLEINQFTVKNL